MKRNLITLAVAMFAFNVTAGSDPHWGYSGKTGPQNWYNLSEANASCEGQNQSPIDLSGFVESTLSAIDFSYQAQGHEIINNGHTVQVNFETGSQIKLDQHQFNLVQYHFHSPSENHINGKSYPLEVHMVHADADGALAVVAVMFDEGAENEGLAKAWASLPKHAGDKHSLSTPVSAFDLLPKSQDYYRFNGSLTTPPCSEGVRWLVMKQPLTASKAQISSFQSTLHEPNNRPIQPLNARVVMQ
ncbi:carbonic anhydrase [Echinimonas agarilytica]|uniref:Carbonic anhydrase n=1 Tax=Echinimonas agarilytica TaxID=1215918 RepID=A0AA42B721_9GAMM|nr:carbonic anhydrase family protein [Echinimonas agarilytica]MCM2679417.1 carbonic anhydrase family protein [Echinimonas agarilytica]